VSLRLYKEQNISRSKYINDKQNGGLNKNIFNLGLAQPFLIKVRTQALKFRFGLYKKISLS